MNINKCNTTVALHSLFVGLLLLLMLSLGIPRYLPRQTVSITCVSSFSTPELPNNNTLYGTLLITLRNNNKGKFNISGTLNNPEQDHQNIILRSINFNYTLDDDGFMAIKNIKVVHSAIDKVPDDYFNQNIADLGRLSIMLKITRVKDAWLFSTPFSPVFMCVNKE